MRKLFQTNLMKLFASEQLFKFLSENSSWKTTFVMFLNKLWQFQSGSKSVESCSRCAMQVGNCRANKSNNRNKRNNKQQKIFIFIAKDLAACCGHTEGSALTPFCPCPRLKSAKLKPKCRTDVSAAK